MWFLTGFIGTPVVVGIINALLTALMSVASTRHSRRKLLLGAKEHLVFFGVLGVGLYIGLNLDTGHLGNNVPSGIWCAILIEVWHQMPRWANLNKPDSPSDKPRLQL